MDTLQLIRSLQNLPSKAAFSEVVFQTTNAAGRSPDWAKESILGVEFDERFEKVIVMINEDTLRAME